MPDPHFASLPAARGSAADPRLYLREAELDRAATLVLTAARALKSDAAHGFATASTTIGAGERDIVLHLALVGGQSVSGIGKAIGMPKPTLARLLNRIEEQGLIERIPDRQDARRREVRLTEAGKVLCAQGIADMRARMLSAFRTLGPETVNHGIQVLAALNRPLPRSGRR